MTELHLDLDEVVYTDDDGLAFTRRDFPAADYPVDSRVRLVGHLEPEGTVVPPSRAQKIPSVANPQEWVAVRWDHAEPDSRGFWVQADSIVRVVDA